ncbi:MAG: hypothetical protein KBG54_06820 [Oscillospiraceae bacterium]|jgi:hypothetical protein|nr:hypothetical protein [Oscillospiraceae bacterium]
MISIIILIALVDIPGRVLALALLMQNGNVRHLHYRTWVLLCAFVNFAWVFYLLLGRGKNEK